MKCRAMEEDAQLISSKKRKCYSELESEYYGGEELAENSVSPAASRTSGCSKHYESSHAEKKSLRSPDLEVRISKFKLNVGEIQTRYLSEAIISAGFLDNCFDFFFPDFFP